MIRSKYCIIIAIILIASLYLIIKINGQIKQYFPCLDNSAIGKSYKGLIIGIRTPINKYSLTKNRIELWIEFKNVSLKPITFVPRIYCRNIIIYNIKTKKRYQPLFIEEELPPLSRHEFITLYPNDHFMKHFFFRPIDDFGLQPGDYLIQVYIEYWGKYYYIKSNGKFIRKNILEENVNLWQGWRAYSGFIKITLTK